MSNSTLRRGTVISGPFCTQFTDIYPTSEVYTETFRSLCIALVLPELQHTVNVFIYVFI
jgi:hypothetical protein